MKMFYHIELKKGKLKSLIANGEINLGGNKKLKIYGTLFCKSGKRMKRENRVFFGSETEAINYGYRPCGHCMKVEYRLWKKVTT
jgi:methylphosphotriester-DNA--protein-cysteine methyltransferase